MYKNQTTKTNMKNQFTSLRSIIRSFTKSGRIRDLFSFTMVPDVLNLRSAELDAAGEHVVFKKSRNRFGKISLCAFHQLSMLKVDSEFY